MRTKTIRLLFLSVASVAFITSCKHSSGGFETDSTTGVVYNFIKHDESGAKGTDSDFVKASMVVTKATKSGKDSILFDSHKNGGDSLGNILLSLHKTYNGCLGQGLMMMSPGDSAEFQINADSFFVKERHAPQDRLPPGVTGTTIYTFHIKLSSFMSKKELMEENNKQRMKYMQRIMALKVKEPGDIADYLKKNSPNAKPDADSIFYLQTIKGKGKAVKEGDSVEIKYRGTFLDGNVFDPGTSNLKMVYSKNMSLVQGWIKIIGKMNEGEQLKVLIPSAMAYGPQGRGQIPPYTPLIFDMELISVKSNK